MKIICAPDSFKESLTAADAACAMCKGILSVRPDARVDVCPVADGGEGTVDALITATGGQWRVSEVTGPLGKPLKAAWGLLGQRQGMQKTAAIEMASCAGLACVPDDQRDPTRTTTFGVGELIRQALACGVERIILGIGGSATTDGGAGMAQALGVQFFDQTDSLMTEPLTGGRLATIRRIDMAPLDPRLDWTQLVIACDVTNPLTGPQGAAAIYAPQKGATPQQVALLDESLAYLGQLVSPALADFPGAGAAGGLGWGLMAFTGATLHRGIDLVLNAVDFDARVAACDFCLTGEGCLDGQSLSGKACLGVAQRAKTQKVKTFALVGSLGQDAEKTLDAGLAGYRTISEGLSLEQSMAQASRLLEQAAAQWAKNMASCDPS